MTTAYGTSIDLIAEGVLRDDVQREMNQLMEDVHPKDFTACELIAVVAICRGVKERLDAQQRPPAPVLELRVRNGPVSNRKNRARSK
jgi:hypothetical protein